MSTPVNMFLDLIKHEDVAAKGIFGLLLQNLQCFGNKDDYLSEHLASVACNDASVMLQKYSKFRNQ
jgi:hypothetical protein